MYNCWLGLRSRFLDFENRFLNMAIPTYLGVVEHGRIRLREDVSLPENATVYVVVPETTRAATPRIESPRLADPRQADQFAKQVIEVPTDAEV